MLATKLRTRKSFLREGPSLHIFVVTLSCDHSCAYCQVSRRIGIAEMPEHVAIAAVDRMFESPSRNLTVEFQGGEPLLAFGRKRVDAGERRTDIISFAHRSCNADRFKRIGFRLATYTQIDEYAFKR